MLRNGHTLAKHPLRWQLYVGRSAAGKDFGAYSRLLLRITFWDPQLLASPDRCIVTAWRQTHVFCIGAARFSIFFFCCNKPSHSEAERPCRRRLTLRWKTLDFSVAGRGSCDGYYLLRPE